MHYEDGTPASLGDLVTVRLADESVRARVVMLGDTRAHLDLDKGFLEMIEKDDLLDDSQVVLEWMERNPFSHEDPRYAPVGNYMLTCLDCCVTRVGV